jgi:uncharacterized protein (TIGR02266 family)
MMNAAMREEGMPEADERRLHARLQLEARVTMASETNFYAGFSENVSEGGVFVAVAPPPAVGSQVRLRISVGAGPAVMVMGEVRWHREDGAGNAVGCGVRFVELGAVSRQALQGMMEGCGQAPLFVEE